MLRHTMNSLRQKRHKDKNQSLKGQTASLYPVSKKDTSNRDLPAGATNDRWAELSDVCELQLAGVNLWLISVPLGRLDTCLPACCLSVERKLVTVSDTEERRQREGCGR